LNEPTAVQQLLNSDSPSTQTTGSLSTGDYVLWQNGAGSSDLTAGTATISTTGSATDGSPLTFTVTGAGTVTVTVVGGPPDEFQLEGGSVPTSFILSAGGTVQRNATSFTVPNPLPVNDFMMRGRAVLHEIGVSRTLFAADKRADNYYEVFIHADGTLRAKKRVLGVDIYTIRSDDPIIASTPFNWGIILDSTGNDAISLNGVTPITDTDITDIPLGIDMQLAGNGVVGSTLNGGITDLQINTDMTDSDWYKDITWDDAVNYLNDYIQYHGRLIPADIDISYDIQYEEAA
jgi:hypothetical protein